MGRTFWWTVSYMKINELEQGARAVGSQEAEYRVLGDLQVQGFESCSSVVCLAQSLSPYCEVALHVFPFCFLRLCLH